MGKKRGNLAELLNDTVVQVTYNRLKLLALNTFVWNGLPDEIDQREVEKALFQHGQALFFKDRLRGYMCLPCNGVGGFNVYNEPKNFHAFGNGYSQNYSDKESVNIRNNDIRMPTHLQLLIYSQRIMEIERTIDINLHAVKIPFVIRTTEKNRLTVENIFKQIIQNHYAIYVDKGFNMDDLQIMPTVNNPGMLFMGDKLEDLNERTWNKALSYLGINNSNVNKRERLITDEVNANNDFVEYNTDIALRSRQVACEEINKMFKANVTVALRNQPEDPEETEDPDDVKGVE
jgi:hypothetical protein